MTENLKIKICGLRTIETVQAAVASGADFIGLVFYPKSPRYITPEAATELVAAIKNLPRQPQLVGLFVNAPLSELEEAAKLYSLDFLQLSGDETPADVQAATRIRPVFKSLRLPAATTLEAGLALAAPYANLPCTTLLLDTASKGLYGGTGETGDWTLAAGLAKHYPLLLAGGLSPENVNLAVKMVQPWGIDVSSGVESAPGLKDIVKIEQFCQNARS